MSKIFWFIATFLIMVTSAGVVFFEPRNSPVIAGKNILVNLVLNERVEQLLRNNDSSQRNGLIVLSTPNLRNLRIPSNLQGVIIKVLSQGEIDELSNVSPVDYMVFDRVEQTHAYTGVVEVTFFWGYKGVGSSWWGLNSGATYFCSSRFGEWVITGGEFWIP